MLLLSLLVKLNYNQGLGYFGCDKIIFLSAHKLQSSVQELKYPTLCLLQSNTHFTFLQLKDFSKPDSNICNLLFAWLIPPYSEMQDRKIALNGINGKFIIRK